MAEAQYEATTRTVEETVVVLRLTEDEADELRDFLTHPSANAAVRGVREALTLPTPPAPPKEAATDTFEYEGVTYDLHATYRDRDGDDWHFACFAGDVVGGNYCTPERYYDGAGLDVIMRYRPLTKVTP